MIKLIADSTCDLSDQVIEQYDIGIAPLTITINGKDYKDRVDIQPEDFYKMLPDLDALPTTGMPSPVEFMKLFEDTVESGINEILVITMSSGTSGSHQSASLAKDFYYEENPETDVRIHVVDSKCMSHGSGYLLLRSAQLIEQGATFDEVVDFNETYKTNIKHFLAVDDLNNLIKSGRLSNASAMIGKLLKVKPIMSMRGGKGAIVAKERGNKKVMSHYIGEFASRVDFELTDFIIIGYTSDITKAENLEMKIRNNPDFHGEVYIMQMGVSVGTHVGLGGLSMYFVEKGDRHDGLVYNEMSALLEKKDEVLAMIRAIKAKAVKR